MRNVWICVFATVCLSVASCDDGGPKVAKVEGTVTVDGQPLAMGKIMMSSELGRQTVGDIIDGKIQNVTTFSEGDGAVVGENRVAIRPSVDESMMMKEPTRAAKEITSAGIPKKFYSLTTTKLVRQIEYGRTNVLEIDIPTNPTK